MMNPYDTVEGLSVAEFEVKRSRFISHVTHVTTEPQAIEFRHGIRDAIPEASHYVSAYILRENNYMHFSDAKEPSGTAGRPVLSVIEHLELKDVVCVVARIFGGTLLGRGGLMRAYTKAAQLTFEKAHIVTMAPCRDVLISVEYPMYERLAHMLEQDGIRVLDLSFADDVTVQVRVLSENADGVCAKVADLCCGKAEFMVGDEMFDMVDLSGASGKGAVQGEPHEEC